MAFSAAAQNKYQAAIQGKTLAELLALFKSPAFWAANPGVNVQDAAITLNVYKPNDENGWGFSNPTQGPTWAAINDAMQKGNAPGFNWLVAQGNAGGFFKDLSNGVQGFAVPVVTGVAGYFGGPVGAYVGNKVMMAVVSKDAAKNQDAGLNLVAGIAGASAGYGGAGSAPSAPAPVASAPIPAAPQIGELVTTADGVGTYAGVGGGGVAFDTTLAGETLAGAGTVVKTVAVGKLAQAISPGKPAAPAPVKPAAPAPAKQNNAVPWLIAAGVLAKILIFS